ncbi:MAG: hypothetical protein ABIY55_13895 [Kofleriaceae bacterium]
MLRTITVGLALGSVMASVAPARANPAGVVPTRIQAEAEYSYEIEDGNLNRERAGAPGTDPQGALPLIGDLTFHQVRQLLTPRAELAVFRNVWVSFAAPIVLADSRELHLAAGVDRTTSSTIIDGILPAAGYDAQAAGGATAGDLVFRGASRNGVSELRGGVGWAPMNQALDDTKPTWKLGVEGRFAIGSIMTFDPANPGGQAGVSTGVDELRLWTSVDRRFRYFEGWFETSVVLPIYTGGNALYNDPGFGSLNVQPGQTASVAFGVETYFIDNPVTRSRFSVDLGARLTTHFEGRGYSEMWEVFALAGKSGGPLVLDADPTAAGVQELPHPGISNIETYLEASGKVALHARIGPHVTLSALGELVWKSNHVISFANAGIDLPACSTGAVRCENNNNDVVDPGTQEVNPLHAQRIDLVGHRYHADDNHGIVLGAEVQILF